jgi:hypothetical protein
MAAGKKKQTVEVSDRRELAEKNIDQAEKAFSSSSNSQTRLPPPATLP